jgi:hypothetical protein
MSFFSDNTEVIAREGALFVPPGAMGNIIEASIADGAIHVGTLIERSATAGMVAAMAAIPATDDNAIIDTDVDMAASEVIVDHDDCDGVIGAGLIHPARRLTITLNSHADWDATIGKLVYEIPGGAYVVEDLQIPNAGNVTLTSAHGASRFDKFIVPPQTSANAKIDKVGVLNTAAFIGLDKRHHRGIVLYDQADQPNEATLEYADGDPVSVLTRGFFYAVPESNVTEGGPVYARTVLSGSDVRGQFSGVATDNFAPVPYMVWRTAASADGLAVIEIL